jgi:hypothetical protein
MSSGIYRQWAATFSGTLSHLYQIRIKLGHAAPGKDFDYSAYFLTAGIIKFYCSHDGDVTLNAQNGGTVPPMPPVCQSYAHRSFLVARRFDSRHPDARAGCSQRLVSWKAIKITPTIGFHNICSSSHLLSVPTYPATVTSRMKCSKPNPISISNTRLYYNRHHMHNMSMSNGTLKIRMLPERYRYAKSMWRR